MIVFDIETGPRPDAELRAICEPFDPSKVELPSGEFDPASVALGNTKDPAKVKARIDAAAQQHAVAIANGPAILAQAEIAHWRAIVDRAALSPVTGQVLAVGYMATESKQCSVRGIGCTDSAGSMLTERDLLEEFWAKFKTCRSNNRTMCGFNIFGFDLPFMVRRSWLLGVSVPETVQDPTGRYFDRVFLDLFARWKCGNNGDTIKLASMAKFFGVGDKPDGINGGDFARLWSEDRATAILYLVNDLQMTASCAASMGFV